MTATNSASTGNGVPQERWAKYSAQTPEIWHNPTTNTGISGQATLPPGTTYYFPGVEGFPENFCVIRLTVPASGGGTYALATAVRPVYDGSIQGDTDFHVLRNGTEIFGRALPAGASASYSNDIALAAGDTIDFAIGRGADNSFHGSGLKIEATLDLVSTNPPPPPPSMADFDLSRDFSVASNPNGAWSYGWQNTLGGALTLMTATNSASTGNGVPQERWAKYSAQTPEIWHNATTNTGISGQATIPPGTTYYFPGVEGFPENFCVIRLTVPAGGGGTYALATAVRPVYDGSIQGDTDFHVLRNGTEIFGRALPAGASASYSNDIALAAGDTIDFAIGRGADNSFHGSGLKIEATLDLVSTNPPPPSTVDFDLSRDFSTASNPNGAWSYGWQNTLGGPLTLMTATNGNVTDNGVPLIRWAKYSAQTPEIWHNATTNTAISGQATIPPGTTLYYPGVEGFPENFCVIRLTVPSGRGGTYTLATMVRPVYDGSVQGDTDYHVLRNGAEIFGRALAAGASASYSNEVALAAGDTIDFAIGRGADNSFHGSGLKIEATLDLVSTNPPPPPPSTVDFDLSRDFSVASNPNGAWSYGWQNTLGGALTLMTATNSASTGNGVPQERWGKYSAQTPEIWHNPTTNTGISGQATLPPGTTYYFPGVEGFPENFCVIRLTVPAGGGGTYALATMVRPVYDGSVQGDTDYHVLRNGAEIFGRALAAGASASYSNEVALAAGDTIDFAIGRGADNSFHGSGLKIEATLDLVSTNLPPPSTVDFDLSRDFSTASNPNGAWSYGWQNTLGGPLTLMTATNGNVTDNGVPLIRWAKYSAQTPEIWHNATTNTAISGQATIPPGTTLYYPGVEGFPENFCVIRLTVPAGGGGTYALATAVRPVYDGSIQGDTDFHVLRNGAEIFGRALAAGASASYSNDIALAAGDTIDFAIGRGADNSFHGSGLKIEATLDLVSTNPPPPPPSMADFDLSRDFSVASNPNGAWSYGWQNTLGGALTLMTATNSARTDNGVPQERWAKYSAQTPEIWHNPTTNTGISGQATLPPGTTYYFPGVEGFPENFCVIRLTVPAGRGGTYALATMVRPVYDGSIQGDTDYHVLRNDSEIFGRALPAGASASYSNEVALAAGDTIDFAIGRGADNSFHGSGLKIEATLDLVSTNLPPPPPPPPPPTDFDLSRDFSIASNPNGAWSYGWQNSLGGPLTLMTANNGNVTDNGVPLIRWAKYRAQTPEIWHNATTNTGISGQATIPPGTTFYFPGVEGFPENFCVIRLTVPPGGGGTYALATAVRPVYDGSVQGDTDFHILRNGGEIFGRALPAGASASYSNELFLAAGDTIDFAIGRGADNSFHGSGLKIAATLDLVSTNPPPPPPPPLIEGLIALVNGAPDSINKDPLLATLHAAQASLARGNLRAALNQLRAFQNKVQAQVAPIDAAFAEQLTEAAQEIIESLDPSGARRGELAAMEGQPARVLRMNLLADTRLCLEGCVIPGTECIVQRSTNLEDWTDIGPPLEISDGIYQIIDSQQETPTRFYRLKIP